jgi:hypothetical protein
VGATGQSSSGPIAAVATAWGLCFTDWNAAGDNGQVVVVSRTGGGGAVPVVLVSVDSIFDTQRRRRNKLTALFNETAVVTGA